MSQYFYAYHGPKNPADFDFSTGYGVSVKSKRDKVNIGDKVFIIQKHAKSGVYKLCGLFEIIDRYNTKSTAKGIYPFRFKLSDYSNLPSFILIDDQEVGLELPKKLGGNSNWSNFQKHFCRQGASFEKALDDDIVKVLLNLLGTKAINSEELNDIFIKQVNKSLKSTPKEREKRLRKAAKKPTRVTVDTIVFKRNPDVVAEVLTNANGICGKCKQKAPFIRNKDKTPYLEVHHKIQLSRGGDDTVANAIALCPNCHREIHYG